MAPELPARGLSFIFGICFFGRNRKPKQQPHLVKVFFSIFISCASGMRTNSGAKSSAYTVQQGLSEHLLSLIQVMFEQVESIRISASAAFERYSARPLRLSLSGCKLSDEEYYLVAAMDGLSGVAKSLGLSPLTDPEVLAMLYYEDDHRRGYINPEEGPRDFGLQRSFQVWREIGANRTSD